MILNVCVAMENKAADDIEDTSDFRVLPAELICRLLPMLSDEELCRFRSVSERIRNVCQKTYVERRNRHICGNPAEFDRYVPFDRSIATWSAEDVKDIFDRDYQSLTTLLDDPQPSRSFHSLLLRLLPPGFYHTRNMVRVEFTGVNLRHLPENFGHLTSLTSLRIYSNHKLESLPESLNALTDLTSLTISLNLALPKLPDLQRLTKITELDISQNPLVELPLLPPTLTKLHAHSTSLSQWPTSLNLLTCLVELHLGVQLISNLDTWPFFPHLKRLDISKGLFRMVPDNASTALPVLEEINLSDNYFLRGQESIIPHKFQSTVVVLMTRTELL